MASQALTTYARNVRQFTAGSFRVTLVIEWGSTQDTYPSLLTSSGGHQSRRYASYWNAFLFWGNVLAVL